MRLIDTDKLNRKDINCANVPMNFIDTAPTVEAIPKAEYENRLKADMVAMLTDIQLEIEELYPNPELNTYYRAVDDCGNLIQQKIDALKAESEDKDENKFKIKL